MAKLQAKKITEALKKAQRVGEVEVSFTVADCNVVLRSLRPEEYEAAMQAAQEFEELQYINAFKREHISRAVCEINGESLREYDFVEVDVEETDPRTGKVSTKTVALERHQFVSEYILATWSREVIDTTFRKFNEVVAKSEKASTEGVEFTIPDETPEEKYRRLLIEAKEIEGQIPFELVGRILDEVGYMSRSSKGELEGVDQKLAQVAEEIPPGEVPEPQPVPVAAPQRAPVRAQAPSHQAPANPPQEAPEVPLARPVRPNLPPELQHPDPEVLMRSRKPLNQVASPVPQPPQAQVPQATQPAQPPPAMQARPVIPATPAALRRAQEIEAMEQQAALPDDPTPPPIQGGTRLAEGIPELAENIAKVNPQAAERIFEQPPVAGINPRFKAPPRL